MKNHERSESLLPGPRPPTPGPHSLGIVADEISRDFAEAVRVGKSLGIRRYEIRNLLSGRAPMCDEAELIEVERIAEREEVEITALSPGLFKMTEDAASFARDMREIYPKAAEWANRWKLPGLIVFGFHKPGATEANPRTEAALPECLTTWLAEAADHASTDGLTLMIEPEPICWCDTGRRTIELIRNTHGLKINYDPGNVAWFTGCDPIEEFDTVAPWIANVHVKDLLLDPVKFVPAGEGIIDYPAHFAALRGLGYTGPISLEPHMDGRPETIRACQQAVERLL